MALVRYRNHEVDVCSSCKGIWLDADEIKPIIHRFAGQSEQKGRYTDVSVASSQYPSTVEAVGDSLYWCPYDLLSGLGDIVCAGADTAADIGGALVDIIVGVVSSS